MVGLLFRRTLVIAVLATACADEPDQISFSGGEGAGKDFGACNCTYDDGSHGDPFLEITCFTSSSIGDVSFFLDPTVLDADQRMSLLFVPDSVPGDYRATGTGRHGAIGSERRINASKIVRSLEGVEVRWDEQDACDAAYGCSAPKFHLAAGAAHGGSGGCQDFWASVDQ